MIVLAAILKSAFRVGPFCFWQATFHFAQNRTFAWFYFAKIVKKFICRGMAIE